ncbi:cytochrome b/b6 domain-containing protein [Flammeovirga sp. EKP202]|uniref:cytochrome b/b6 domain-containing protein n=1 Tax=Flammeovirga sp. EKP202 TaxID=2770592 RepID=UPI00165F17F7|nr:cytochrome b/b6 domain-containing protein [Flammeovirga sp. EKP202]MBD0400501.1 cytochrome b/b6 domain-containing protein [Flammeovirga sp. EKP202]
MTNRNFSLSHRLLHWLIAFTMLFILMTIFLRENWMSKYYMRDVILNYLGTFDIEITKDQAMKVAKAIRGNMWQWHINAGYLLIGLYVLRLLTNAKEKGIKLNFLSSNDMTGREKVEGWVYFIFYVCIAGSLITGMSLIYDIGDHELMEDMHKLSLYYLVSFIVIHFFGIVVGELRDKKNIVSKMIHGKNN